MGKVETIKARADYLRVRGGGRAQKPAFVVEGKPRQSVDGEAKARDPVALDAVARSDPGGTGARLSAARFGFTITRKLGNAVVRNRMRRRLKAALGEIEADHAVAGMDYVVVARGPAETQDFASLKADLAAALDAVNAAVRSRRGPGGSSRRSIRKV